MKSGSDINLRGRQNLSAAWTRVAFMESVWDAIRRYGTQPVMRVGLNQPITREVLGKTIEPNESDGLTESVTEEPADTTV